MTTKPHGKVYKMKTLFVMVMMATVAVAGCNTTQLNKNIQAVAPGYCAKAAQAYSYWNATGPSDKERAAVNQYYRHVHDACQHPSQLTAEEIGFMIADYVAMKRAMR